MSCSDDQKGSRCTGHCCEGFCCPPPAFLRDNVDTIIDGHVIMDMLIPLGPEPSSDMPYETYDKISRWRYDCRFFNKETRQCMDYEGRPGMCRNYPYDRECQIDVCALVSTAGLVRRV